ncbi:MAG: outer membrane protein assembly factor BamA [Phycisphaerales bacterium]
MPHPTRPTHCRAALPHLGPRTSAALAALAGGVVALAAAGVGAQHTGDPQPGSAPAVPGRPPEPRPEAPATPPRGPAAAPTPPPPPPPAAGPAEPSRLNPALEPFENRLIREVKFIGLSVEDEALIRNQVRSAAGRPLSQQTVQEDIARCTRLGRFKDISARIQPFEDQTVLLTFEFAATPIIADVQVVGNRQISDGELRGEVSILAGTPVDRFQLDRTLRRIEDLYRKKGYYQAQVTIDQEELDKQGIVLFRIREGERLKVRVIQFEGNTSFPSGQIRPEIKTEEADWFTSGTLDDNLLDQDVATIVKFYRDRGHLDVRADRQVRPSPDGKEAILTFLIDEGPVYTLRSARAVLDTGNVAEAKPPTVLTPAQIGTLLPIKPGDTYSVARVTAAVDLIRDAYGQMGYVDASVAKAEVRDPNSPQVDLLLIIREGTPTKTGLVVIKGNDLTQEKIIRRQVRVLPDRPLDTTAVRDTEELLEATNLFAGPREGRPAPRVTIQNPDPANPGYRDVLIEVDEKNTGSLGFGAAVSSDSGVIGQITLTQRNFDLYDTPDSFGEFFTGKAFRGAGQIFNIALQPGTETSNYSIGLTEPSLFGSEYTLGGALSYRQRQFDEYDEDRLAATSSIGRVFGQRWSGNVSVRAEAIDIYDVAPFAADDIKQFSGESTLSGVGVRLTRSTLNSRVRPTGGTRFDVSAEWIGALSGDYDFTKLGASHQVYLTLNEDYLGRKTTLTFKTEAFYIPQDVSDVPVFERYYLGGRSFRGFAFRGVSPRGLFDDDLNPATPSVPGQDPVGGTWAFFFGPEVEFPLVQKIISVVAFMDTGTVTNEIGFDQYRVSVGGGVRLYLPQLGPAPLAFDFGFPIAKQDGDDERLFSFAVDLPF